MDTRTKIVDTSKASAAAREWRARGGRLLAVTGYFDVLQASHVRELAEARRAAGDSLLMALLVPPPDPVQAPQARAELAAGLAMVDYVVTTENGPALEALLAAIEPDTVVRLETADELRMRQLIEHVHRRHTGA
ncbi:MAG TPA: hypothetical protein VN442_25730 [Bryobacteraceae bacterium]|nr:hypothetical protein [Bryobacteraceae bacterium]